MSGFEVAINGRFWVATEDKNAANYNANGASLGQGDVPR